MWQQKDGKLYKKFNFKSFSEAINFMSSLVAVIEKNNHHPEWKNVYNEVEVWLTTHSAGSITQKDHDLSKILDDAYIKFTNSDNPKVDKEVSKSVNNSAVKLYTDGGSRGNPGPSAIGYVLVGEGDEEILKSSKYLGITTNNQAEYQALKEGLETCLSMNIHEVDVYMDSLLVVNQIKGIYKVKNRDLWPTYEAVKEMISKFNKVRFTHVPRELNKVADSMVNKCLDEATH